MTTGGEPMSAPAISEPYSWTSLRTAELAASFSDGARPACTLIPVPRLALDGMLFEIEAVAALPARASASRKSAAPRAYAPAARQ